MLKRISIIAFFTGCGQLLSVFVLKYISEHSTVTQLQAIAEIDSLLFFIVSIIALGLQTATMRNLVLTADWKQEYNDAQSARITLGVLLMSVATLAFINQYYLLFLVAPILAWSGDYALYARGHPITGSIIAFIRIAVPFAALLAASTYYPDNLGWVYVTALTITYIITNLYIYYFLKADFRFSFSFKKLQLYITTLPLGVITLAFYFLGLGLILPAPYVFIPEVVGVAFLGLKFYMIFKGALRIIHQAFIKELVHYDVCFKVDQIGGLMGLTFATFVACFPASFIGLFFGKQYIADQWYFIALSVAGLVFSLFYALSSKAILDMKDKPYAMLATGSALLAIVLSIIAASFWQNATAIGLSLLAGEIVLATGAIWLLPKRGLLLERLVFFIKNLPFVFIPLAMRYFMGDNMKAFIISAAIFGIAMLLLHYKRFGKGFNDLTEA